MNSQFLAHSDRGEALIYSKVVLRDEPLDTEIIIMVEKCPLKSIALSVHEN